MADLGEQALPLEVMAPFDYVALGHFHNHCQVAPRAFYAGSTERLSQSERTARKGFLEITLEPFSVSFHEVASRPMVDLPTINAAGKRGDQLISIIREKLAEVGGEDAIVRVNVDGISPETIKTIPAESLAELRQRSFDLNIRYERPDTGEDSLEFGRSAIGRLDHGLVDYIESLDLDEFDRDRLIREALQYLNLSE